MREIIASWRSAMVSCYMSLVSLAALCISNLATYALLLLE